MKIAIGKQIKALRKNKGVSQEAVADYLNISQSAYSRIENGDSLGLVTLKKFVSILKLNQSIW